MPSPEQRANKDIYDTMSNAFSETIFEDGTLDHVNASQALAKQFGGLKALGYESHHIGIVTTIALIDAEAKLNGKIDMPETGEFYD